MANRLHDYTLKKAGEIAARMSSEGYQSVWEKILDSSHRGPNVYTLWVHLESGITKLTSVENYHSTVYIVTPEKVIEHIPEVNKDGE